MAAEPMVTIKKADGTTERVPLSQVRKKKSEPMAKPISPIDGPASVSKQEKPAAQKSVEPPAPKKKLVPPPKSQMKPVIDTPASSPPPPPKKDFPAIVHEQKREMPKPPARSEKKSIPVPSKAPALPKMEKKYASHDRQSPVKDGARKAMQGMKQLDISNTSKPRHAAPHWDGDDHVSLLDESLHQDLPAVIDTSKTRLSTSTPVKDIFKDEAKFRLRTSAVELQTSSHSQNAIRKDTAPSRPVAPMPFQPKTGKPQMHDVRPGSGTPHARVGTVHTPHVASRSVGPVDEMASLTVQDFRRLGGNVPAMKEVFMGKFLGFRKESFMMYSDAVRAWRKSPLYQQYLEIISSSLQKKQPVDVILAEQGGLNKEEFEALIEVNMQLGM